MTQLPRLGRHRGFTLIELMVTMVITILITGAVYIVYVSTRQSFQLSEASARNQEIIRYALDSIGYDLRHAGHVGCNAGINPGGAPGANKMNVFVNSANNWAKYTDPIKGYSSSVLPAGVFSAGEVVAGTDVLWIQYFSSKYWPLTTAGAAQTGTFQVYGNPTDFANTNVMLLADCVSGEMFVATDVVAPTTSNSAGAIGHAAGTYNTSATFSKAYGKDADLMRFVTRIYYIGTSNGQPTLMRKNLVNMSLVSEEIADNIADMKVTYGVDSNSDGYADVYRPAVGVLSADWPKVVTARVCLLYRSSEANLTEKKSPSASTYQQYYDCGGYAVDATDQRFRQAAVSSATFRNRVQ